jgi:hypothetical protein
MPPQSDDQPGERIQLYPDGKMRFFGRPELSASKPTGVRVLIPVSFAPGSDLGTNERKYPTAASWSTDGMGGVDVYDAEGKHLAEYPSGSWRGIELMDEAEEDGQGEVISPPLVGFLLAAMRTVRYEYAARNRVHDTAPGFHKAMDALIAVLDRIEAEK